MSAQINASAIGTWEQFDQELDGLLKERFGESYRDRFGHWIDGLNVQALASDGVEVVAAATVIAKPARRAGSSRRK